MRSRSFVFYFVLAGFVLLSGCRMYGNGKYGTETKTYQSLQMAVDSFEKELNRATSDLHQLEDAAAQVEGLGGLAEQYHTFIEEHKSLLETQRERLERLSADSNYRNLHNAFGATVTEQRMMRQKYHRVIRSVSMTVQGQPLTTVRTGQTRQYTIRPIGFPTQRAQRALTMEQALRGQ